MSTETALIKSLYFTNSVGARGENDETFSDVLDFGGFPFHQNIKGITQIDVYSDTEDPRTAVVVGLKVTYMLKDGKTTKPIPHGVVNVKRVGQCFIDKNQILVGVYGQLKKDDGRLASISFVLFDEKNAKVVINGPFHGSEIGLDKPWANFGHTIAFQGTRGDGVGLTSLGFIGTSVSDS